VVSVDDIGGLGLGVAAASGVLLGSGVGSAISEAAACVGTGLLVGTRAGEALGRVETGSGVGVGVAGRASAVPVTSSQLASPSSTSPDLGTRQL
jgi:hypothetical protein